MNNDLISRTEAIDVVRSMTISLGGKEIFHPEAKKSVLGALDDLPAVDAEVVRRGRWSDPYEGIFEAAGMILNCSECNAAVFVNFSPTLNYCPNCGAKMDGEHNDVQRV